MKDQIQVKVKTGGAILVPLIFLLTVILVSARVVDDLSGEWTGTMEAGSRPGTVELTLNRDGAVWSATVKINWNGMEFANPVRTLSVTDKEVTLTTEIGGATASFTGRVAGQTITGTIEATANGRVVGTGSWTVTRNTPVTPPLVSTLAPDSKLNRMMGEVLAIDPSLSQLSLKLDNGETVIVKLNPQTSYLRVPLGEKTLEKAAWISLQVVGIGDRVYANGQVAEDRKSISARQLIVMAKTDLAQQQERDRADWRKRGIAGTIITLNPASKEIALLMRSPEGDKPIIVAASEGVLFRRYALDSIKFSDAKPGSFAELRVGDQLRARGEKSNDGLRFTPVEIVSGTFRSIGGTIIAVNAEAKEVKVQDVQTQQPLTVVVNQDSLLRRLPPDLVAQITKRVRAAGSQSSTSAKRPANEPDLQETLERLPSLTVADLKPGDRVIISSTRGAQPERVTAIGLFIGVDTVLKLLQEQQAAQRGSGTNLSLGLPGGVMDGLGRP